MSTSSRLAAAVLMWGLVISPCLSCRRQNENQVIAAMVADMAARAEKRDAAGLIAYLASDYGDHEKRDREQTADLIENYFSRYRGIVIHVLASRIAISGAGSASLETDVSFSSGAARAFRKMIRFSGENYRFRCRLRKDDRWLITRAEWEYVPVDGLFPESMKIFRELFPN